MQADIVMWTKNGKETLPFVMDRINEVIPSEVINRKIVVDDHSTDHTRGIADLFGWRVILNEGTGISDGANTALKNVESDLFISFEQDLLLSKDWFRRLPYLVKGRVAVASGMRFASAPLGVKKLQQYVAKKYRGEKYLSPWLKSREMSSFTLGKTLDNTIYRTDIIRQIGGFPKLKTNAGVDTVLAYKLQEAGYVWQVDYTTQSVHLRKSLRDELKHQYSYGCQLKEIWRAIETKTGVKPPISKFGVLSRLLYSPLTGVFVAVKTLEPSIVYMHPLIRFYYAKGLMKHA